MLKAVAGKPGEQLLIIGLSFGNLNRFKAKPKNDYIAVLMEETGLRFDVMLYATGGVHQTRAMVSKGRKVLLIGFGNAEIESLLNKPGKTMIRLIGEGIDGKEEIGVSILIFSAETDIGLSETVSEFVGPDTITKIDPRLLN